jgi:hypothetical protein
MGHDNLRAASSQMLVVEHVVPEGGQFPHPQVRPDGVQLLRTLRKSAPTSFGIQAAAATDLWRQDREGFRCVIANCSRSEASVG